LPFRIYLILMKFQCMLLQQELHKVVFGQLILSVQLEI